MPLNNGSAPDPSGSILAHEMISGYEIITDGAPEAIADAQAPRRDRVAELEAQMAELKRNVQDLRSTLQLMREGFLMRRRTPYRPPVVVPPSDMTFDIGDPDRYEESTTSG